VSVFSIRLKQVMDERKMKPAVLARMIGVDRSTISKYLNQPGKEHETNNVLSIARVLNVNSEWLYGHTDIIEESEKCSMIANKYLSLAENTMAQQELIMDYLQKNYTGKIIVLDVGNFKPKNNTEFFSMLDWVRSVGFPESEEAVERKRKDSLSDAFYATLFSYFGEDAIDTIKPLTGTIDYPALFLDLGLSTADESLSVKFLQKVIELTDGDKYNKHRLSAEKLLKEKNGNQ